MKRLFSAGVTLSFLAMMIGCHGGGVSISVSPSTATVPPGQTQQFTASVSGGGSNSGVTWQVNSIIGGNSTVGTVTAAGLYTAPAVIPSPATVTITAVPAANTLETATASVTIADTVSVSPASAVVSVTATQQFSATVTFSSNTSVTWQVNGVAGGNATVGTISTTGTYTAPSTVPSPPRVTITAVSQADSSKTSTATVLVTPPPIEISPTTVTVAAGSQQGFTATVLLQSVTPTWSVQCPSAVQAACGTITADGVFTAPLVPPLGGSVTITASMADGSALSASVTVPIQISDATLVGTYVFGVANQSISAFAAEAGVISFDGVGTITGGTMDRLGTASPITITGGTYSIGTDGRGTAILQTDQGPLAWQFVMATNSTALIARLSADGNTLSGSLHLQQASATTPIQGKYSVGLSGVSSSSPFTMVAGLSAASQSISSVLLDEASGTNIQSSVSGTGTYGAPAANGRGTLTLSTAFGNQSFVYYAVDSTHLKLLETDGSQLASGDLYQQSGGSYSLSSFNERLAFTLSGFTSSGTHAIGGLFTLDGNAGVPNRLLDGVNQTVFDSSGIYLVTDANSGRTTLKWSTANTGTSQYVLYPIANGGFVIMETDGAAVASGLALQQTLASPSSVSLVGQLALGLAGTDLASSTPVALTGSASISQSAAWTGTLDSADSSGTTLGAVSQVGSFSISTNGRGVATLLPSSPALSGSTLILYVIDTNNALLLETDSSRVLVGTAVRQY